MILPDTMLVTFALNDEYFDLRGLSAYSKLGVSTLRDYIRRGQFPAYKVKGKVLIKRSKFDVWVERHQVKKEKRDLNSIANDVIEGLK